RGRRRLALTGDPLRGPVRPWRCLSSQKSSAMLRDAFWIIVLASVFADGHRAREWHAAVTRDHARAGEATTAHTSSSPDGCGRDAGDVPKAKGSSRNSRKQRTPQP